MNIRTIAKKIVRSFGYEVYNLSRPQLYSQDCLTTFHNHDFMRDPRFIAAYARGKQASGVDHLMHWRVHVALWVASQVKQLPGAFVECGVSTGFLSSAIMHYIGWNSLQKSFYLFDTFAGLDPRYTTAEEQQKGRMDWYHDLSIDKIRQNFAEFQNVHLVQGTVPETLGSVDIPQVCYLSLDMNCTAPEIAAAEYFWPRMVRGGMILMDDYAYAGYEAQHHAFNQFARDKGIEIMTLPTGQGLILKL